MKMYDLIARNQKSFYRKAFVVENDGKLTLFSYDTPVVSYNSEKGFVKHGRKLLSATMLRHVRAFAFHCGYGFSSNAKRWVKSLPFEKYGGNTSENLV